MDPPPALFGVSYDKWLDINSKNKNRELTLPEDLKVRQRRLLAVHPHYLHPESVQAGTSNINMLNDVSVSKRNAFSAVMIKTVCQHHSSSSSSIQFQSGSSLIFRGGRIYLTFEDLLEQWFLQRACPCLPPTQFNDVSSQYYFLIWAPLQHWRQLQWFVCND